MSTWNLLRFHDARDVYRLIGDCRDLGSDPALWQPRLLEGACKLVGSEFATTGEGRSGSAGIQVLSAFDLGLDTRGRKALGDFLSEVGPRGCPIFQALRLRSAPLLTYTRSQLVADREWYASLSFQWRRFAGNDHALTSLCQTSSSGAVHAITLSRELGRPDFTARQQQLLSFLHAELGRLIGAALVSITEPSPAGLAPRLQQTLACVLEGDSEKQVAARLGLSLPTVHQYVGTLYRHFGVRSRAQLLAHFIQRLRAIRERPVG